MDRDVASKLVEELSKHTLIFPIDEDKFLEILMVLDVPESSRFYHDMPENEQILNESDRYHYLSLRRVLRNRNAANYKLSGAKKLWEKTFSRFFIYDSNILTRRARIDEDIAELMIKCEFPFSLLGKLETYDSNDGDKPLLHIKRPVLVIPDLTESESLLVSRWERSNSIVSEERLFTRKKHRYNEYFGF
ncbi:hypothetical protein HYT25_02460 [Candidatus Pacearchaeota archaeon]|nr:hypothetical protein [Candidatus Pacearchaeota archaeon]